MPSLRSTIVALELRLDRSRQEVVEHRLALGRRQRIEVDRGRVALAAAPGRALLEELGASGGDDHDRALCPVGHVVDEVQQAVIGPVDVVQHEDQRVAGGEALEEAAPGLEQLLAAHVARFAGADERPQLRRDAVVTEQLPRGSLRLAGRHLGRVVVEDLALRLDGIGEGGVGGIGVGQASAPAPVHDLRQPFHVLLELGDEPGLADAGRPDHGHQRGPAVGLDPMEGLLQDGQLLVAADEAGLHAQARPLAAGPGLDAKGAPRRHRLGLALELERLDRSVLDDVLGAGVDAGPHHDLAGLGRRLQAGGGVHRVAGQHPVPRSGGALDVDQHLAGLDPDAHPSVGLPSAANPRFSSDRIACISRAARTARSASSSCERGTPKTARTASPMNFSSSPS